MTLGLVKKDKIFYSKATGINKPVIYVGSKTGRDGIHGASMASASFDEKIEEKKPKTFYEVWYMVLVVTEIVWVYQR